MKILIAGASGATGRLLTAELLRRGCHVIAIVRSPEALPDFSQYREQLTLVRVAILDLSDAELARHVKGCDAVASCLGHNLTLQGIYGRPRRLVTDATRRLCNAIRASHAGTITKFVLMNTTGNRNRDLAEPLSFGEKAALGLIRLLLPPHSDNEHAAEFLRTGVGPRDPAIEWAVVRPDTLTDAVVVSDYTVHASPTRSAIFNAGQTSRSNVAHFMAEVITDDCVWNEWKGRMPVIYNAAVGR
jgi:NAD(P)-dependent dehydrogenase (short-subunit alcohol dehydrogenase family)